ncbi:SDR family NAD(P)-dependent oxidoreductase [Paenibacillus sacheonensis]|uniref:Glucose 1-dehydrogenase n=1 Tax=Paenibacillus sacheonensis TaxID=742054 RepID=A0A7X4YPF7_9BACL|nr:SDR family NAD(P)-dependent oxidoreductase [Paenibacillus sacheonensis]MBM7565162.1 NAD(P)-dependent dehydrogenase (short-subunit alcohol dehydrogenase family) [Paenibacillus sacheonensis]NBC70058.1 glucose 1-dehydrogenase [Paenibacillus sacheonensis]
MQDRVAIVTGAASGIGRGIAEVLLREGCRVSVLDWNEEIGSRAVLEMTEDRDRVRFIRTDVSREADISHAVERTVAQWGTVDILVNNVGTHYHNSVERTTADDFDKVLTTDLRGHFLAIQNVLPFMKEQGRGSIVNIASVHALQTQPHFSVYAAVKGGVVSMSRSIALEYAPLGIRINTVLPGMTRNSNVDRRMAPLNEKEREDLERKMARNIPLGRIAEAAEIGEAVAFLASDRASFITGSTLVVDGGESSHLSWR